MSSDRLRAPVQPAEQNYRPGIIRQRIADLVADAFKRGQAAERARCADVASLYPVFAYDGDTGELLRLRDNISQAIEKLVTPGQPIP